MQINNSLTNKTKKEQNMKKIIFTLLALVGTMSMNAQKVQVMKIYNGDQLVAKYKPNQATHVVFVEELATTGTEKRTGNIDVNWVQLWENGPKFAEYNVGAANNKAEDYGVYYAWGGSQNRVDDHNTGSEALTGDTDTATKLWGDKWRMPTKEEFQALLVNCNVEWIDGSEKKYNNTDVTGLLCTGKGEYLFNSVFLPAAGYCDRGSVYVKGDYGLYWSCTPDADVSDGAHDLYFVSRDQVVGGDFRRYGGSVRAVLAEE